MSKSPRSALWAVAARLLDEGCPRDQLLKEFEALRQTSRTTVGPATEDDVLDVMDAIVGWTGPKFSLANRGKDSRQQGRSAAG
jgi:hypothetical protein